MDVEQFLKNLPNTPGVYQMLDKHGKIIYVGKAKNLKNRVKSYFQKNVSSKKTEALMQQVVNVDLTVTDSDNEALLLELNLIKQHRPRYNVLMRDDKSYPYLYLSTDQKFPRLDYHRGAKRIAGRYFGPYPNAGAVRENLALIQKLFKVRQCKDSFFQNRTRPCLQYQIKRCTAPCVDYVSVENYQQQVENTILFLEGKNKEVIDKLTQQMDQAANNLQYEEAAYYRDVIVRLRRLQTEQFITGDTGDVDIIGVAMDAGQTAISILFVRAGRLIGNKSYFPRMPVGADHEEVLSAFIPQFYLSPLRGDVIVERIVIGEKIPDKEWIENVLHEQLGKKIIISDHMLPKYRQWQLLAVSNAKYALSVQLSQKNNVGAKLAALQTALKLPNSVQRIECFDISHTQGEATIASCVVYGVEGSLNKEYRRFNIKNITPGDDYAAMRQALVRRYTRVKSDNGVLPDLLIIDGGLGQLQQAIDALEEVQVSGVVLMGVAKGASRKPGLEKIFIAGHEHPIFLPPEDQALHLIQFIRDEAHRFAIAAHRAKRGKARTKSPLEHIEGIGAKRRQALLKHFGGWQELSRAGVSDIEKVVGISRDLAQKIYDALHA